MPTTTIQLKRDTAANWTSSNRQLAAGQFGYETDTGKYKVGDGATGWTSLGYRGGPVSAFVLTLLDDTTAAAFLATLGHTTAANTMNAISNVIGVRHTVTSSFTDAQIKAMPTTALTILAAPGSSLINVPLRVYVKVNASAALYTNINAACEIPFDYTSGKEPLVALDEANGQVTDLFGTASVNAALTGSRTDVGTLADFDANALRIRANNQGSGDFTGGNAANTMVVTVEYIQIPV